jgi:pyruvate dehydrogenase (quinone)/pyruvate oxidase
MSEEQKPGKTLSDAFVERLLAWGVDTIFGIPGDQVNGFMEALRKAKERIRFVHVRHEEVGALAAVGYAKLTGKLGVCLATAGPGAVHLLNGVIDAHCDRVPVLAITGSVFHDLAGLETLQEITSEHIFEHFTLYNQRVMGPAHVDAVVDAACRRALAERGPVHLTIPNDFQSVAVSEAKPSAENVPGHTRAGYSAPVRVPERASLEAAAQLLAGCKKIVILAGTGSRGAARELEHAAETLGAPIVKALLGKDVIADDNPYCIGGTGHIATMPSKLAMDEADALLVIGSTMPFLHWYPKPGQAKCVQIDDKPERIGMRHPVDVALAGDARATLAALLPLLTRNDDRAFLDTARERMSRWWQFVEHQGTKRSSPMKPQVVAWELSALLADDAILVGDAGTVAYWISRCIRMREGQRFSISGINCTMGAGLSYAIGAQAAFPQRQVVALVGDGAATMVLGDLATLRQFELPVKIIVIVNESVGLERWEQLGFLANPEYGDALHPVDFCRLAEGFDIRAMRIDDPARCREQLAQALQAEGPMLIECIVDPNEPAIETPLVPRHAENFGKALEKGTPDSEGVRKGLLEHLRDEQRFIPEAIDEASAKLLKKLESMGGG